MSEMWCDWWDCKTKDLAEWQQEQCEKKGMTCMMCVYANERMEGAAEDE